MGRAPRRAVDGGEAQVFRQPQQSLVVRIMAVQVPFAHLVGDDDEREPRGGPFAGGAADSRVQGCRAPRLEAETPLRRRAAKARAAKAPRHGEAPAARRSCPRDGAARTAGEPLGRRLEHVWARQEPAEPGWSTVRAGFPLSMACVSIVSVLFLDELPL